MMTKRVTRANSTFLCPVCDEEVSASKKNNPTVQCKSNCGCWFHRKCAGLNLDAFKAASSGSVPFHCSACRIKNNESDIAELKLAIESLTEDVTDLKTKLSSMSSPKPSYAAAVKPPRQNCPEELPVTGSPTPRETNIKQLHPDRKSNLIIFGQQESSKGTPRHVRQREDIVNAGELLTWLDPLVTTSLIVDTVRLGTKRMAFVLF